MDARREQVHVFMTWLDRVMPDRKTQARREQDAIRAQKEERRRELSVNIMCYAMLVGLGVWLAASLGPVGFMLFLFILAVNWE